MLPGKIGWTIIIGYGRSGQGAFADKPGHFVIYRKSPVPRGLGMLGNDISAAIIIEFDPSGKTEWANIIQFCLPGKSYTIIHPIEPKGSPYPTGSPSILKSMQGTIHIIAGGITQHGSIGLIKCPVGNQSKVEARGGIGIVLNGTRQVLMPVEKSILILITIPENKIYST